MNHGKKLYESWGYGKIISYPNEEDLIAAFCSFYSPEAVDFFITSRDCLFDVFTKEEFRNLIIEKLPDYDISKFEDTFQKTLEEKLLRVYFNQAKEQLYCYVSGEEWFGFFVRSDSREPIFIEMKKFSGYLVKNIRDFKSLQQIPYYLRRYRVFSGPNNTKKYDLKLDLDDPRTVLALDDIQAMLKRQTRFALAKCLCRESVGDCSEPIGNCMYFDEVATYNIEIGQAEEITYEQAKAYINLARKKGLVNYGANVQNTGYVLCSCCKDCCQLLQLIQAGDVGILSPSRFVAEIDQIICIGCGMCKDRCPAKTIAGVKGIFTVGNLCIGCGLCTEVCDYSAVSLKLREDATDIIPKYKNYHDWDVEVKKLSRQIHDSTT